MVEFLKDVKQIDGDFTFEEGKRYPSMTNPAEEGKILILQPNSPKNHHYWSSFPMSAEGSVFRLLDRVEMTTPEIIAENKVL